MIYASVYTYDVLCGACDKGTGCTLYIPACVNNSVCVSVGVCVHTSLTHHARRLKASGKSGLTMTVELNRAERETPPKSDKRAPLTATTGSPEALNFSAWRKEQTVSKTVIEKGKIGEQETSKAAVLLSRMC